MLWAWPKRNLGKCLTSSGSRSKSWCPNLPPVPSARNATGGSRAAGASRCRTGRFLPAIVYVLRTGCQWKALPKGFGSASAIHPHFQQWRRPGFFLALWRAGLAEYDEMEGIAWEWQSMDGAQGKAPLAEECGGPNPTDRGKKGAKRSLLVDGRGVPLSLIVSGANVHDVKLLAATLDGIVVVRPQASRPPAKLVRGQSLWRATCRASDARPGLHAARPAARGGNPRPAARPAGPALGGRTHAQSGSTGFASCWCATKKPPPTSPPSCNAPLP